MGRAHLSLPPLRFFRTTSRDHGPSHDTMRTTNFRRRPPSRLESRFSRIDQPVLETRERAEKGTHVEIKKHPPSRKNRNRHNQILRRPALRTYFRLDVPRQPQVRRHAFCLQHRTKLTPLNWQNRLPESQFERSQKIPVPTSRVG